MAFPSVHYGNFGDEKVTSTSKINGLPLGMKMILPDGSEYVHARAGGTAVVVSKIYQAATAAIHLTDTMLAKTLIPADSYAVGATTVAFTTGGTTAVATDALADGYLVIASGDGAGYKHKIKTNNSAASGSTTCTLTLYETDGLKVALAAGTTKLGVIPNSYAAVILTAADTIGAKIAGVPANSCAASAYFWAQRKGEAAVFTGGTVLLQRSPCVCSTAVAGAVVPIAVAATTALLDTKESFQIIGVGLSSAATAGYSLVDLNIT